MPVGMIEGAPSRRWSAAVPGDKLVIYSDGLTETENAEGEFFGTEGLRACARDHFRASAAGLHDALLAAQERFSEGGAVADDITVLVLEYAPPAVMSLHCLIYRGSWRFRRTGGSTGRRRRGLRSFGGRMDPHPALSVPADHARGARRPAPSGKELVLFGERQYARFSRAFEHAATEEILRHDPGHDGGAGERVSEGRILGPRRARLSHFHHLSRGRGGVRCRDVFRGWVLAPETTVRWYPRLRGLLPAMARLVWEKQEASVRYSRGLIMPSEGKQYVEVST